MSDPIQLVTAKTDQQKVDDYKARMVPLYEQLCDLATEANNDGFAFQVVIGPNALGKFSIQQCQIVKVYK